MRDRGLRGETTKAAKWKSFTTPSVSDRGGNYSLGGGRGGERGAKKAAGRDAATHTALPWEAMARYTHRPESTFMIVYVRLGARVSNGPSRSSCLGVEISVSARASLKCPLSCGRCLLRSVSVCVCVRVCVCVCVCVRVCVLLSGQPMAVVSSQVVLVWACRGRFNVLSLSLSLSL